MSKIFKNILLSIFVCSFIVLTFLGALNMFPSNADIVKGSSIIVTLDNKKDVDKFSSGWANRTSLNYSNGYLNVCSKYTDVGGVVTDTGREVETKDGDGFTIVTDTESFGTFSLDEFRYFQMKIKRENCESSKMQFYVWSNNNTVASRDFVLGDIDDKWVIITLDLYQLNSSKKAVWLYDVESDTTTEYNYSSITGEFEYTFDNLRINFGRQFLANKRTCVEYLAFFSSKDDALSYKGSADKRLENAESILKDNNTKLSSIFGDANTEEKALSEVSNQISNVALVGSEILDYVYTPSTVNSKGSVVFSVKLQSAGKEVIVNDLSLVIDEIPSSPIVIRLNNQETIDKLRLGDVTMTLEDGGYAKMTKINPRQEDCFYFEFDTPGITDSFILQNYSYIKIKYKPMQVSGKFQIYYSDFVNNSENCRSFLTSWDVGQWQTAIIDTSISKNSIEVLNLETGKTTTESCYNGAWGTGFDVVDFTGNSSDFRFTFGRKDNLERTTYIEYIAFFPTLEMAREYDEQGEKYSADVISKLQEKEKNNELFTNYGNALSEENAKDVALAYVQEIASGIISINTIEYISAGYNTLGKYVFTAQIENEEYGVNFTTPYITITIDSLSNSSNILWKFNNEQVLSNILSLNISTDEATLTTNGIIIPNSFSGFKLNLQQNNSLSLLGYPIIKIRYKANDNIVSTIDVINGAYKFGINFTLNKSEDFIETILSLSTKNQFLITDNGYSKQTITTIGELNGCFDSFIMKLSNQIEIDYISFSTDLSSAMNFDGNSNSKEKLDLFIDDNTNNFNITIEYNQASTEDEAKEYIENYLKGLISDNIKIERIVYSNFTEASVTEKGSIDYTVQFSYGGYLNFATNTISGKLIIDKESKKVYTAVVEEDNGDFDKNYHEFWGTDSFYDTKAENYDATITGSQSYNYTNYLYTENDLTDIPNSFEIWLKLFESEKGREQVIFNNNSIRIAVATDGNIIVKFGTFNGTTNNINLFDSVWHHLAITRNNNIISVYVDGIKKCDFNTLSNTEDESDKNAYTLGGELFNADGRLVANDVIIDVSGWETNKKYFSNDSVEMGMDANSFFYVSFYNSNKYSFTLQSKKYVRLINDIENSQIVILTDDSIDNLYLAKDIIYSISKDNEKYINIFGTFSSGSVKQVFLDEETFNVMYGDKNYTITTNIYGQTTIKLDSELIASFCVSAWNTHKSSSFSTQVLSTSLSGRIGKVAIYSICRSQSEIEVDANLNNYDTQDNNDLLSYIKMDYSKIVASGKIVYEDLVNDNYLRIYASGFYKTNLKSENVGTIAIIGDVQNHVVKGKETFDDIIADWIIENKDKLNISAGFSVGDITQNATQTEWQWAYDSFSKLDGIIPYLVTLGNHDYPSISGKGAESRDTSAFNNVWDYQKYKEINKIYADFGVFEIGKMDNAYLCFDVDTDGDSICDNKFILFVVEYGPRDEVLEWVNFIAKKYSNRNAIIVTHAFMRINRIIDGVLSTDAVGSGFANDSSVNEAVDILEKVIKHNDNFIAVYCGHLGASDLAFHSLIQEYNEHNVIISITDMSAGGKYFPSNDCLIGLSSFNKNGDTVNYMYSPLYSAYFNTDLILKYQLDFVENRG